MGTRRDPHAAATLLNRGHEICTGLRGNEMESWKTAEFQGTKERQGLYEEGHRVKGCRSDFVPKTHVYVFF